MASPSGSSGILSLKWNNHRSTFFHVLSSIRLKETYTDVTIACDETFFQLHKLVLATCSEYFEEIFQQTSCKHPVIVLKDIKKEDFEALLCYMYLGEVNVEQDNLSRLINAAECLRIKGLAVPDEDPAPNSSGKKSRRSSDSPVRNKRRKRDDETANDRPNFYEESNSFEQTNQPTEENEEVFLIDEPDVKKEIIQNTPEQLNENSNNPEDFDNHTQGEDSMADGNSLNFTEINQWTKEEESFLDDHSSYQGNQEDSFREMKNMHSQMKNPLVTSMIQRDILARNYSNHMEPHSSYQPSTLDSPDTNSIGRLKSYSCSFCNYKTYVKTNYTTHVRTHTGERPYQCNFCDYKSSQRSNLKAHMLRHTKNIPKIPHPLL